jgi:hypothetical protein
MQDKLRRLIVAQLDRAEAFATRVSKTSDRQLLIPVACGAIALALMAALANRIKYGPAQPSVAEARHQMYVAKCEPLKDKYMATNRMNSAYDGSDEENARIAWKVCEAGERVDAIVAGEISIPGR